MTRIEVSGLIYEIIKEAAQRGYPRRNDVELIFTAMGKLTPEPKAKPEVPQYDESMIQRVRKLDFTDEQRASARAVLRDLGLI